MTLKPALRKYLLKVRLAYCESKYSAEIAPRCPAEKFSIASAQRLGPLAPGGRALFPARQPAPFSWKSAKAQKCKSAKGAKTPRAPGEKDCEKACEKAQTRGQNYHFLKHSKRS